MEVHCQRLCNVLLQHFLPLSSVGKIDPAVKSFFWGKSQSECCRLKISLIPCEQVVRSFNTLVFIWHIFWVGLFNMIDLFSRCTSKWLTIVNSFCFWDISSVENVVALQHISDCHYLAMVLCYVHFREQTSLLGQGVAVWKSWKQIVFTSFTSVFILQLTFKLSLYDFWRDEYRIQIFSASLAGIFGTRSIFFFVGCHARGCDVHPCLITDTSPPFEISKEYKSNLRWKFHSIPMN